jgi:hypothetical protein
MQVIVNDADRHRSHEEAARTAFEQLADRKLNDAEWARVRTRLLELARILRTWASKERQSSAR